MKKYKQINRLFIIQLGGRMRSQLRNRAEYELEYKLRDQLGYKLWNELENRLAGQLWDRMKKRKVAYYEKI